MKLQKLYLFSPHFGVSGEPFINSIHFADVIKRFNLAFRSSFGATGFAANKDDLAACKVI